MSKAIIFDTETTGLAEEDKIIQVGAIVVDSTNRDHIEVYDELCSSDLPIKIEAMSVHGIREGQLLDKPNFIDTNFFKTLNELNNESNYLIAHNLDFDLGMLEKYDFQNQFSLIDTLQCAKHLFEIGDEIGNYKVPNHKLQTFRYMLLTEDEEEKEAEKYEVEIKAHDAIGDVVILKLFFKKLIEKTMQKYNIKKYHDIMNKLVFLTKEPAEVKIINFGQYAGKKISEIENMKEPNKWGKPTGPSYIDWLFGEQKKQKESNDSKFNKDLYYTLDKIIKARDSKSGNHDINTQDGLQF